jgi:AraC family transcriptional regulator
MLICNLSELAETVAAPELFKSRWGRESWIIWGRASRAAFGPCAHTLSIRAAWGGQERCQVDGRTIAVDDDNFLILNHGQIYSTRIDAPCGMESLAICFGPKLIEQLHARTDSTPFYPFGPQAARVSFLDNLHPHEQTISPILQRIRSELMRGLVDDAWFEEQLVELLARMQRHHAELLSRLDKLPLARPATRSNVYRRIALATDFVHTHYTRDINLEAIAKVAAFSKYHFVRLFTLVHGIPPHKYLQRKRAHAAIRLLQSSTLTTAEIVAAVGLREETTLRRHLQCWAGQSLADLVGDRGPWSIEDVRAKQVS